MRLTIKDVQNAVTLYEVMQTVSAVAGECSALAGLTPAEGRQAHSVLLRLGLGGLPPGHEEFTAEEGMVNLLIDRLGEELFESLMPSFSDRAQALLNQGIGGLIARGVLLPAERVEGTPEWDAAQEAKRGYQMRSPSPEG